MGILDSVVQKILDEYGITKQDIEKVKTVIDKIDVSEQDGKTVVEINLKKITITIDT